MIVKNLEGFSNSIRGGKKIYFANKKADQRIRKGEGEGIKKKFFLYKIVCKNFFYLSLPLPFFKTN